MDETRLLPTTSFNVVVVVVIIIKITFVFFFGRVLANVSKGSSTLVIFNLKGFKKPFNLSTTIVIVRLFRRKGNKEKNQLRGSFISIEASQALSNINYDQS